MPYYLLTLGLSYEQHQQGISIEIASLQNSAFGCYYVHFTGKKTNLERKSNFLKATQLVNSMSSIQK